MLRVIGSGGLKVIEPNGLAVGDFGGVVDDVLESLDVLGVGDVEPVEGDETNVATGRLAEGKELRQPGQVLGVLKDARSTDGDALRGVWLHFAHPEVGRVLRVHLQ